MDNNKPNGPSDGNSKPPLFGSNFDPHSNPVDPNNPYATPPQPPSPAPNPNPPQEPPHPKSHAHILTEEEKHQLSELAKHRAREHGHFVSNPPDNSTGMNLPPLISTKPADKDSKEGYPPIFQIANPVTYLKIWWKKVMSNEGIDFGFKFKIKPVTAVIITTLILSNGVTFGVTYSFAKIFFPNSSPILHRQVVNQGTISKNDAGVYYLMAADSSLWKLKVKHTNINLSDLAGKQVIVTGNLSKEKNLIEVSEVIISETSAPIESGSADLSTPDPKPPASLNTPAPSGAGPVIPNQDLLPKLYSGLQWDLTQRKVLLFTSGKRRIEQEGVYMESAQVNIYPQDFVGYYTAQLTNSGFKETLNSKDPDGITMTYSKEDLYLTFGVKNIFSGSGDNKKTLPAGRQVVGYKAYIEHN